MGKVAVVVIGTPPSGHGYGDGSGHGYGDGYGDGDGYGSGDGSGHGYGHGYGSGDGYGHGYGYGDGSGYGDGDGGGDEIARAILSAHSAPRGTRLALWWSNSAGKSSNGGKMKEPARPGLAQEVKGPLTLCGPRALHGTHHPMKWKGSRLWVVALHEPVIEHEDKMGSLKRTILTEIESPFGPR